MPTRIILDTDTGVDDALAILLAMRSPEVQVEAITAVSGNAHVDRCARNILLTLETLNRDSIPDVAKGEAAPLVKPLVIAGEVHGDDGLGGVTRLLNPDGSRRYPDPANRLSPVHAVDLMLDRIGAYPDELTLIAVGPLANVARAIITHPARMRKLRQIVIMGGAFRVYGNVSPVAEFNIFVDPHAAQVVCQAGIPLIFVPLDVTQRAILTTETITRSAAQGSRLAAFVHDCTAHYVEFHRQRRNVDGCFMHDPLAVAVAFRPDLVDMVDARVDVETSGDLTAGMTMADLRPGRLPPAGANARVCVNVNAEAFLTLFMERVLQ